MPLQTESLLYSFANILNSWFCFHAGRPSSLSLKDVVIEYAQDPFIRLLVQLCITMTRSTDEIYGQRHESLLHMWKVARSIEEDLRGHEAHLRQALGFGFDDRIQAGSLGVRQAIYITCKSRCSKFSSSALTGLSIQYYPPSYLSPVPDIPRSLAAREERNAQPV
jgi:hypothetical protein